MRSLIIILVVALAMTSLPFCQHPVDSNPDLRSKSDSMQKREEHAYQPGLGEFMSSIQVHHAKLWFAGINRNWPLADFEIHEIREAIDDIREYNQDRPEIGQLSMIEPVIDTVLRSIQLKDEKFFRQTFTSLTATCNGCHQVTQHGFNVVVIPTQPPYSNQDFLVH